MVVVVVVIRKELEKDWQCVKKSKMWLQKLYNGKIYKLNEILHTKLTVYIYIKKKCIRKKSINQH